MELISDDGRVISTGALIKKNNGVITNGWDQAHQFINESVQEGIECKFVEPNLCQHSFIDKPPRIIKKSADDGYLNNWPKPDIPTNNFIWHLTDNYSQLMKARDIVLEKSPDAKIRIAIIDTGFQANHPALPMNITDGISYIQGEKDFGAIDMNADTPFEQDGHGTATMCILAGREVNIEDTGGKFKGSFGAIPFATIIPIRISETVALVMTDAFEKAVEYAISKGCEVISMSMAGAPSKSWARAVNKAYENGVIMVTAAGNSWTSGLQKFLPKRVLYPARWDRVIAATGASFDHLPYVFDARLQFKSEGGEFMQGNYGPASAMDSAIAAYTPNIPWATLNEEGKYFRLDGGGTSSATPQVAAAAALWICYHRKELDKLIDSEPKKKWKKVEMVKRALFKSADKFYPEHKKYYGNGILRAADMLDIGPSFENLKEQKEASVLFYGVLDLLGLLLRFKSDLSKEDLIRQEMVELEIMQLIHTIPSLQKFLDKNESDPWLEEEKIELRNTILVSPEASNTLKRYLGSDTDI